MALTKAARPDWRGRTVVCIASGPSLTPEDCERVRRAGHPTIVINTSFRLAPWADVLFAHDTRWWANYTKEVDKVFKGRKMALTYSKGVERLATQPWYNGQGNSGACAIAIAVAGKAAKIVLLGYDCKKQGDQVHWHGNHPAGMSNALTIDAWPKQFARAALIAKKAGIPVVNASRDTALDCFSRGDLEATL